MATVHFIGGEKGGVGKSLVARLLAQYMIDHQMPFLGFDSDRSHGALLRFYPGFASPVVIDQYESLDAVIEAGAADPHRRILVDLAAQTHQPLVKWMEDSGVLEIGPELCLNLRYWHVMDSGKDSVDILTRLFDRFGAQLQYVIVLNQLRGESFEMFEHSGLRARALSLGARIITLGRLHEPLMTRIDARSTSFWAAANSADKELTGMGILERQRVKVWLKKAYTELDSLDI